MKIITNIYIFALYVLLIPGFFIKNKLKIGTNLLHSFLFTLIIYFTLNIIEQNRENYNEYDVEVKGVNSLVDLINTQFGGSGGEKQIDIHNQIAGSQGNSNMNCWNALGKNQKELEIIKVQLDNFSGTNNDIDKLNNQLESLKKESIGIENKLIDSQGSNKKVDQLSIQIRNYQKEINTLQQQINMYNATGGDIKKINQQVNKLQSEITDLNLKISECMKLNENKVDTIDKLNENIKQQRLTITKLKKGGKTEIAEIQGNIGEQGDKITYLKEQKINAIQNCQGTVPNSLNSLNAQSVPKIAEKKVKRNNRKMFGRYIF